jgi:hypothetical protein
MSLPPPIATNPSTRLLVLCARLRPSPGAEPEVRRLLEQGPDWEALLAAAEAEGTLPLLFWNLRNSGGAIPGRVRDLLKSAYLENLRQNGQTLRALAPFLDALRREGLKAALTKGARLAPLLYGDPGLRPFWDVDFIVRPRDWPALTRILDRFGFAEAEEPVPGPLCPPAPALDWTYSPYFRRGSIYLEFHFNPLGLHLPTSEDEDLWASARMRTVAGTEALVLSDEHELCYLCLHAQQHSYERLIWLTDIAETAARPDIDWQRVLALCRRHGIAGPVSYALRLARVVWPGAIDPRVLARFPVGPVEGTALRFLYPEESVSRRARLTSWPYYMPSLLSLWERRSPGLAAKTLASILFPPRTWMARVRRVPPSSPKLYIDYVRRLWRPVRQTAERLVRIR